MAALDQGDEVSSQFGEFGDALVNVLELGVQQFRNVGARWLPIGSDIENAADFGQCKARSLGSLDEPNPLCDVLVIDAISVGRPSWRRQEAATLVEPNGLGLDPALVCKVTDSHSLSLRP